MQLKFEQRNPSENRREQKKKINACVNWTLIRDVLQNFNRCIPLQFPIKLMNNQIVQTNSNQVIHTQQFDRPREKYR